ncbi:MAG: flagellar biosynthesis regulator FlaF [Alphaproteobacteria bacterium]
MQPPPNNSPHAKATGIYDTNAKEFSQNQRELEGKILLKSNKRIQEIMDNWDDTPKDTLEETLKYNRKIWMLFYDTARENKESMHSNELRNNISTLADFIFKREIEILSNPQKEKLAVLISINKQIAVGLMTPVQQTEQ